MSMRAEQRGMGEKARCARERGIAGAKRPKAVGAAGRPMSLQERAERAWLERLRLAARSAMATI